MLEAQRRSGLSLAGFCRRRGLSKGTLSFWKWKLAREAEGGASRGASAPFVAIQIAIYASRLADAERIPDQRVPTSPAPHHRVSAGR